MVLGFNSAQSHHSQGPAATEPVQRIIALIRTPSDAAWLTEAQTSIQSMDAAEKASLIAACQLHDNRMQREIVSDDAQPSNGGMRTQPEWAAEMKRLREVQSLLGIQNHASSGQRESESLTIDLRRTQLAPEPVVRLQRQLIAALTNHDPHSGQAEAAEIRVIRALMPAERTALINSRSADERIASLAFMRRSPHTLDDAQLLSRIIEMEKKQSGTGLEFLQTAVIPASQDTHDEPWWRALVNTALKALF